jgi:glutamine amidotransferase
MCELMGLSFARPVSADFSFRAFAQRGEENADGWGLAWYPDRSAVIVKEPSKWAASSFAGFLESYPHLRSTFYIAHVRHKTTGGPPTYADTHPFLRELQGRDYVFAHNGTLEGPIWDLPARRFRPIGTTDSERACCLLLDRIADRGGTLEPGDSWPWLYEQLVAMNQWGKLNVLMSDGRHLFAYHDLNGYKGLAYRPLALSPRHPRHLEDADVSIDLVDHEGDAFDRGHVVASRPLGGSGWRPFAHGELIVFGNGRVEFSSTRDS